MSKRRCSWNVAPVEVLRQGLSVIPKPVGEYMPHKRLRDLVSSEINIKILSKEVKEEKTVYCCQYSVEIN